MHDLTPQVRKTIADSAILTGTVNVFNVGSTAAVGTIEFEPGLQEDLPAVLDRLIPASRNYGHEQAWHDGNAHSHLRAAILGRNIAVGVNNGELTLGRFQSVIFAELDGPRTREINLQVIGE